MQDAIIFLYLPFLAAPSCPYENPVSKTAPVVRVQNNPLNVSVQRKAVFLGGADREMLDFSYFQYKTQ